MHEGGGRPFGPEPNGRSGVEIVSLLKIISMELGCPKLQTKDFNLLTNEKPLALQ